jgi:23S rRNA (adenine1618-N6)-methyltransferase
MPAAPDGIGLHPRNRHQGRYDLESLLAQSPALAAFLIETPRGERSIDFRQPAAVRALNAALLRLHHGVVDWDLPAGYLCPPIPGRADYLHGLADLLAGDNGGVIPRGASVCVFDVGVGANVIYPLIGRAEYGWRFVGSDIDPDALSVAQRILDRNGDLGGGIELRAQPRRERIYSGLLQPGERFAASLCNPPFHASAADAARASERKWRGLGRVRATAPLNFGGRAAELWCSGGEAGFLRRMIDESATIPATICWFSSLVARSAHLPALQRQLRRLGACEVREVPMAQGNKRSRFLAWSFLEAGERAGWSARSSASP